MRINKDKGITLIALVITIIVLLILAGVSIATLVGDNGILNQANNAKIESKKAQEEEEKALQKYEDIIKEKTSSGGILKGKGTEAEPYVISNIEDLVLFSYNVNKGNNYAGKYVQLEKNLDFNSDESYIEAFRTDYGKYGYDGELKTLLTSAEGFKTIGTSSNYGNTGNGFAGTFDGNGKVISNLKINKNNNIVNDIGLFSTNEGVIKNLGIDNCNIDINPSEEVEKPEINCGSICGFNFGEIDNCWASGSIDSNYSLGKRINAGGISGGSKGSADLYNVIKNCYNKININVIKEGTNSEHILAIGGIIGSSSNTEIKNCYNTGNIVGKYSNGSPKVGGIAGYGATLASKCYNLGEILGTSSIENPVVGGIVAQGQSIESCCNIGLVSYEGASTKYVGVIIGAITETVTNSYFLNNTELNGIGRNYSNATEPTKVDSVNEMPTVLDIVGDAFKADTNNINKGYPILSWQ